MSAPVSVLRRRPLTSLSLLSVLFGAGLVLLASCDPRDFWTAQPALGLFAGRGPGEAEDAVRAPPPAAAVFAPGAQVAWISTFCVQPGHDILAVVELRQDGQVVFSRSRLWLDGQRRCGPLWGTLRLPPDLPPGRYDVAGVATARPGTWFPVRREVWRFGFDVAGPAGAP